MNTRKLFLTSLLAAAAMSVPAYADAVALRNGEQTALTPSSGVAGAGNTYTYTAPEEGTTDNGGWLWLGNLRGTGNVALGSAESNMALSGSGLVVLGYQGGDAGTTYNFDLTNTDASAFSGKFAVVNQWNNSTVAKLSGTGWSNVEYVFAGVSREQNWVTKRMYNDTSRGYDTLALQGATTLAGITGTSKGYSPAAEANAVAAGIGNINLRESITVATSGTVLTLSGAGTYGFYGSAGTESARVGVSMTGTGTQTLGGTTYLDNLSVTGGTLVLSGTANIAGTTTVGVDGELDLSGGTITLASAIQNSGSLTFSANTALKVLATAEGDLAVITGNTAEGWDSLTNISVLGLHRGATATKSSTSGVLTVTDGSEAAKTLTWAGTSVAGTWNYVNSNWTDGTNAETFYQGDNVNFTSAAANKTVVLESGSALSVGTMTVASGDYMLKLDSGTASVTGSTLTVASGASLQIGNAGNVETPKINLGFSDISLAGTLKFKNGGASTWSSLTFEEGGKLYFLDGKGSTDNLTISQMTVNGAATITSASDKGLVISNLSGAGALSVVGNDGSVWGWSSKFRVKIESLLNYTGTATFTNGNHGLEVSFIGDSTLDSASKLVFGTGVTVKNTGNLTLAGTVELSNNAITNTNGTISVDADSVNFVFDPSTLAVTSTDSETGARTYTLISGGTITNWSSLTADNFDRTYFAGRETASVGTVDGQVVVSGYIANLVWAGTTAEGGNLWNTSTTNKPWTNGDTADAFYAQDNVTFTNTAANKTVSISGDLDVGTITVSADGYTFSATDNATITSGAITVSATNGLTLEAAQDKTLTITNALTNGSGKVGAIEKTGSGFVTLSNSGNQIKSVTVSAGTLNISGVTSNGTTGLESITIASGATLSVQSNDMVQWGWNGASFDISGRLELNNKRFSISGNSDGEKFKLNGGTITGTGDGNGALDFFGSRVINVSGESTISAKIRVRDANNGTADFNVAQESSLALSGELILAAADKTIKKSGAGTLNFTSNTKDGNTAGTFEQAAGMTNITAGTKNLSMVKVTGGTLNISGGSTTAANGTTVSDGGVLEISTGGQNSALRGTLTVNSGGKVKLMAGDATGWGGTNAITKLVLNEGAELYITEGYGAGIVDQSGKNQTFNMSGGIELTGAKITGTTESGKYSKFDLYNSATGITVHASSVTSEISTVLGLRKSGSITVEKGTTADGVDLLISGMLTNSSYVTRGGMDFTSALTKSGEGTMKLTGDNQYWTTGGSVTEGTLIAASTTALGKGGTISVSEDATLGFVAETTVDMLKTTTTNDVTTTTNGTIQLASGAKIVVDMSGKDANQEKIVLDLVSGVALSYGGVAVTADNVGTLLDPVISLKNWGDGWTQSLSYADSTLRLTLTIPEPSVFGLLAGLGALALAGTRRRRKKA